MSEIIPIVGYRGSATAQCRGLQLENKMEVLLISDKNIHPRCMAALNIRIGSMHEPGDVKGLAHLLEHVICRKLNSILESDFAQILERYGEQAAGMTHLDNTTYSFTTPTFVEGEMLSQFAEIIFESIDKDIDEHIVQSEMKAVDSEYVIDSTNDPKRLGELIYAYWNTFYLRHAFQAGNNDTLLRTPNGDTINIMAKLIEFHELYSPNIMSLCVIAKDSLDTLQQYVERSFSDIPNTKKTISQLTTSFLGFPSLTNYCTAWFIVPTLPEKMLYMQFELPFDYRNDPCKSAKYVTFMLRDRRQGSLLAALRNRHWSTSINCTTEYMKFDEYKIWLALTLTQQGLDHIDDIITLTFQYLRLLREGKSNGYYKIFHDDDISKPCSSSCDQFAHNISAYSLKNVLITSIIDYYKFLAIEVDEILEKYVVPKYFLYCIAAKENEDITNKTTPWRQTKYTTHEIPHNNISQWSHIIDANNIEEIERSEDLQLPQNNEFEWNLKLPNVREIELDEELKRMYSIPRIFNISNNLQIWCYIQTGVFEMYFQFYCGGKNATDYNLNNMLVRLIQDYISEYTYCANIVGIQIHFESNIYGISFCIGNRQYARQLSDIVMEIITRMMNVRVNEDRFEMLKEQYITFLKEKMSAPPNEQATHLLENFLTQGISYDELLKNVDISMTDMSKYIEYFRKNVFVECLIRGYLTLEEVNLIKDELIASFQDLLKESYEYETTDAKKLETGSYKLLSANNSSHKSSCTMIYYQVGWSVSTENRIKRNALLRIIHSMIRNQCNEYLRFRLNLGYIAKVEVKHMYDSCGLVITVVGHNYETVKVENDINTFINQALEKILTITEIEFENYKCLAIHYIKPTRMVNFSVFGTYWQEIISKNCLFTRSQEESKYMETATLDEIRTLFKEMINTNSQRKVSIHILPNTQP